MNTSMTLSETDLIPTSIVVHEAFYPRRAWQSPRPTASPFIEARLTSWSPGPPRPIATPDGVALH